MEQNNTVPVKLSLSGSKKRARLHVPLKISQLRKQVQSSFPNVKEFDLQYVDEEGDNITVNTDEDLAEAQSVFKTLGRVISFVVDTSSQPERPVQSRAPAANFKFRKPPLRPMANAANSSKSPKGKSECNRNPCPKPCAAKFNCTFDFNHLGKMASKFLGQPAFLANTARSFIGPATGDVVELHSLSTADFNGRRGRCGYFDRTTGRHRVVLFATKTAPGKTIAVHTRNLKAVRPSSPTKDSEEREQLLPTKNSFGPGSFGPDVVMLQKALVKLGYMHPSAIRYLQGFYGPRTTTAVAKIAKAIGCTGGGAFTDRVRAHLLHRLASLEHCNSPPTGRVSVPITFLRKVSTLVPPGKSVTVPSTTTTPPRVAVSVPPTTTTPPAVTAAVTVPTTAPTTAAVTVLTPNAPTAVAVTVSPTTTTTPRVGAVTVPPATTTAPPTAAVTVPPTKKSVTVPPTKKSATVPPTKVQQLLDMGITLPVETLRNVLSAANDDVGAALTVLLGHE